MMEKALHTVSEQARSLPGHPAPHLHTEMTGSLITFEDMDEEDWLQS
jgi:hypothetical protein